MAVLQRRKMLGMTRDELAEGAKVSSRTLGSLERGRRINKANARLAAYALGWTYDSADQLLGGGEPTMRDDDDGLQIVDAGDSNGGRVLMSIYGQMSEERKKALIEYGRFLASQEGDAEVVERQARDGVE